jgi:hypothetical protein
MEVPSVDVTLLIVLLCMSCLRPVVERGSRRSTKQGTSRARRYGRQPS